MANLSRRTFALLLAGLLAGCGDDSPTQPVGPSPEVHSISPAIGTVGTEVRLDGSGFSSEDSRVYFGEIEAADVELADGALFAHAPAGLELGESYDVRVVNENGAEDMLPSAFEAVAPRALRVNGVTRPTGLKGMTVIIDGEAFGDLAAYGAVYFTADDGTPIEAAIADPEDDWADGFVVTTVPEEIGETSEIWVETATGTSDPIEFTLIGTATFSPSTIDWHRTTDLPQGLRGLGAAFVPVEVEGEAENWVYVAGGADEEGDAVDAVIRSRIAGDGSLEEWDETIASLPEPRAHHTLVAATPFTAALDTLSTAAQLYVLGGLGEEGEVVSTVYAGEVDLQGSVANWREETPLPEPLHSAGAALFRGYLYLAGGADADHVASDQVYRARVHEDGSLGSWESLDSLPQPRAYFSLVSFGPYLYAVGGETDQAEPNELRTGTETADVVFARIDLRTGGFRDSWAPAGANAPKARSKHSTIFSGGYLFTTSGLYSGLPGSSENEYSGIGDAGELDGWNGATGVNTIQARLGYSLYGQAAISFVDAEGNGRVLVLGGGRVESPDQVSDAVVYF